MGNKEIKLRPCPFCGSKPNIECYGREYWIECKNEDCEAQSGIYLDNVGFAMEAWNRRIQDKQ